MSLNEYEVERMAETFDAEETPNLFKASRALERFIDWVNGMSDGWAYWQPPRKAAAKLMEKLQEAENEFRRSREPSDLTAEDMKKLFDPMRVLITKYVRDEPDSILFPPPPKPEVSFAPDVAGVIDIGGVKTQFRILLSDDSTGWQQWGDNGHVHGERVGLLEVMADAAREWANENLCRTCKERLLDDGEGYDGECGDCADRTESEGRCNDCGLESDEPGPGALCASCRDGVE